MVFVFLDQKKENHAELFYKNIEINIKTDEYDDIETKEHLSELFSLKSGYEHYIKNIVSLLKNLKT